MSTNHDSLESLVLRFIKQYSTLPQTVGTETYSIARLNMIIQDINDKDPEFIGKEIECRFFT